MKQPTSTKTLSSWSRMEKLLNDDMFRLIFSFVHVEDIHNLMLCGRSMYNFCIRDEIYKIIHDEIVRVHEQFSITEIFDCKSREMVPYNPMETTRFSGLIKITKNYRKNILKHLVEHQEEYQKNYQFQTESNIRKLVLPSLKPNENWDAKFVLTGITGVGKSSLAMTIINMKNTSNELIPTIFDYYTIALEKGSIQLWDSAGHEDYDRLRPLSYQGTDIVLLCYSIDSRQSFMYLKKKFSVEARFHQPSAACVLVACKTDLRQDMECIRDLSRKYETLITYEEGRILAKQLKCLSFFETSSMNGEGFENIPDFFTKLYHAGKLDKVRQEKDLHTKNKKCLVQ